ncbi:aminoglycoside phosphotransferase [Pelagivirga sediminicola]|uniref:Aminoglycoside phosphotransferase n=2 Tax=Pelagivirga sediminicola TaxID=2170575 RepID=A0A2T7G3V0_9RHOB|nr:aminoglycoside phosphotransferase [Pelagivirga sediminicola]
MPLAQLLPHLDRLAQDALALWDLPEGAIARRINVSENTTYRVDAPGRRAILRIHRAGYHSRAAITSELDWIAALDRDRAIAVPGMHPGRDGQLIQSARIAGQGPRRRMVLFDFVPGRHPEEGGDLAPGFEQLGAIAARCHIHARGWRRPAGFERPAWDLEAVFGPAAPWGDWRAAPHVTPGIRDLLEEVQERLEARLARFGRGAGRYGLIHSDMRLANVLIGPEGPRLIDFDDCGFGWFLYDFAAAVSFVEDDPRLPALKAAWLRGYERICPLAPEDKAEMDSFIMLRRMALLAWIGSRRDAPEPQSLAPHFARGTEGLARRWLGGGL